MKDEQPWCVKCWSIRHISRYYSAPSDRCGWCSANHAYRTCPYCTPPMSTTDVTTSTSEQLPSSPQDTSKWKWPSCHESGDNVWHGCTRRTHPVSSHTTNVQPQAPPPPPPPQPRPGAAALSSASPTTDFAEVLALRALSAL